MEAKAQIEKKLNETLKKPFRVGFEGVVVLRSKLDEIDLYTDGLSGCAALVAANSKYVFMAHVPSGSASNTMNERAKNYLKSIIEWMKQNGGEPKVGLVSNEIVNTPKGTFALPTAKAFEEECKKLNVSLVATMHSDSCKVVFSKEDTMELQPFKVEAKNYNSNIYGTFKNLDFTIDTSNEKLNPHEHKFGKYEYGDILSGDYSEKFDNIKKDWISCSDLRKLVLRIVLELTASKNIPQGSFSLANTWLNEVNELITNEKLEIDEEDRKSICEQILKFDMTDSNAAKKAIADIVTSMKASCGIGTKKNKKRRRTTTCSTAAVDATIG